MQFKKEQLMKKEAVNLKESKERYMEEFAGRTGKRDMM